MSRCILDVSSPTTGHPTAEKQKQMPFGMPGFGMSGFGAMPGFGGLGAVPGFGGMGMSGIGGFGGMSGFGGMGMPGFGGMPFGDISIGRVMQNTSQALFVRVFSYPYRVYSQGRLGCPCRVPFRAGFRPESTTALTGEKSKRAVFRFGLARNGAQH